MQLDSRTNTEVLLVYSIVDIPGSAPCLEFVEVIVRMKALEVLESHKISDVYLQLF